MNIVIVNTLYHPLRVGGAEVSVQLLAEDLVRRGHSVSIITIADADDSFESLSQYNGVNIHRVPLSNLYWPYSKGGGAGFLRKALWHVIDSFNVVMARRVCKLVKQIDPDIVHTNNLAGFSPIVLPYLKRMGIPIIHTARDYYLLHPNCTLMKDGHDMPIDSLPVRFWTWVRGRSLHNVDHFVGISNFVVKSYLQTVDGLNKTPNSVIYNSVDVPNQQALTPFCERNSVGFMGRLNAEKGFECFVKLSHEYATIDPAISFIAAGVGDQDYIDSVLRRYPKNSVQLIGFCRPEEFFSQVRVVVLPTLWNEPFGRVAIEALAHQCLVLMTSRGGLGEIAELVEGAEIIVDIDDFAHQLKALMLGGDISLSDRFQSTTSDYIACYESLLKI